MNRQSILFMLARYQITPEQHFWLLDNGEHIPVCRTKTSSPLSTKFAATKSHPNVPDPETANGCAEGSVLKNSCLSIDNVSPNTFTKVAPTWLSLKQTKKTEY
jgi:hypothetical protein